MEIGDIVIAAVGCKCKVTKIFQDGIYTMAKAKPIEEFRNRDGLLVAITEPVETLERRTKGEPEPIYVVENK